MIRPSTKSLLSLALLILIGVAGPANAALIDSNDPSLGASNDGQNLTLDTTTGFSWLDIDVFAFTSQAAVITALTAPAYEGFVVATRAQVEGLFLELGLGPFMTNWPNLTHTNTAASTAAAIVAQSHVGYYNNFGNYLMWGSVADPGPPAGERYLVAMQHWLASADGQLNIIATDTFAPTASGVPGTWVYRPGVVPEPSTFSMLAFSGIAMAGYSRLRRRRK